MKKQLSISNLAIKESIEILLEEKRKNEKFLTGSMPESRRGKYVDKNYRIDAIISKLQRFIS